MSCREESNRAPTAVMTMAVYRPYCGGKAGEDGVGHGLRHGDRGHRQAGQQVRAEDAGGIGPQRLQGGDVTEQPGAPPARSQREGGKRREGYRFAGTFRGESFVGRHSLTSMGLQNRIAERPRGQQHHLPRRPLRQVRRGPQCNGI